METAPRPTPSERDSRIASIRADGHGKVADDLETLDCTFLDSSTALVEIESGTSNREAAALIDIMRQAQALYEGAFAKLADITLDAVEAEVADDEREGAADARDRSRRMASERAEIVGAMHNSVRSILGVR